MQQLTRAFNAVLDWLLIFGAFCMAFLSRADVFARARMTEMGWTPGAQTSVEVVAAAAAVLFLLRAFAPVLRVLLILLLLTLALQWVYPTRARHSVQAMGPPCASAA